MKKSISFNGAQTFYTIQGSGIPVLLLHGFGEDSSVWENLASHLVDYKLIIPNLPGSGPSEDLVQKTVSMSDYVAWIALILKQENIDAVHFVGHSMGGYIAMEFANRHKDKLGSLTLFHSSAFADDEEKKETRRKSIVFIESHGASAFLTTSIPPLFKDPGLHGAEINKLIEKGNSFSSNTLVQYYKAMIERKDHASLLSTMNFPVLFIIGEHDKAVPLNISLKQCYLPAISFVHILRKSAHMSMFEEPGEIAIIVNDFLKAVTIG